MAGKTLSARLNEEMAWELEFLMSSLGNKKATEVIVAAIHYLYLQQKQKESHQTPADFLEKSKFIGGTEGGERDSVDYKKTLSERIGKK